MPYRTTIRLVLADSYVRAHTKEIVGLFVTTFSVVSATQEQTLYYFQLVSYGVGVVAGGFTIWSIWRNRNKRRGG